MDYHRGDHCISGFSLPGVLADPDVVSALTDSHLAVIMATAYDGTSFADCITQSYFNPDFYSQANTARMVAEYSDFVYRLNVLLHDSGKTFILSNWEGDNALYCGQAYTYTISAAFREQCAAGYPTVYGGALSPHQAVEGMVLWMKARYLGVTLGRERARSEGLTGFDVFVAPEICAVHMLHALGLESVLYDVIPRIPFDYVSYSSYESLGGSTPAQTLMADLDVIRTVSGSDRIIIGEFGFSRSADRGALIAKTQAVTAAAIAWGVSYIIQWNLYDEVEDSDFGLFDVSGRLTELGTYYQQAFRDSPGRSEPGRPRGAHVDPVSKMN